MVAYKKFTKIERANVVREMLKNIVMKEIKPSVKEIENELTSLVAKNIPAEVIEFEKKYPQIIDKEDVILYGHNFLSREEQDDYAVWSKWNSYCYPSFTIKNVYNNMIDGIDIHGYHRSDKLVSFIKKNAPGIAQRAKALVLKKQDLEKWSDNLSCTLKSITTINRLKNEFPEAYSAYVNLYGNSENCKKIVNSNGNTTSVCDNIEKLRAEYNKVVDKVVVDKK